MLQAKVKPDFRFGRSLQAFNRVEFVKDEWRDVPVEYEPQAKVHQWLEVRERPVVEAGAIEVVNIARVEDEAGLLDDPDLPSERLYESDDEPAGVVPAADQDLDRMLSEMRPIDPIEQLDANEKMAERKAQAKLKAQERAAAKKAGK